MSQTKAQLIDAVDGSIVTADLADDVVNAAKLASNAVVNASVDASAAIAGTKISPDFGSQNIVTTGTLGSGNLTITAANPSILFTENDQDPDFNILCNSGQFRLQNITAGANLFTATASALNSVIHHDFGGGIDVTGAITASTNITATGNIVSGGNVDITGNLVVDTSTLKVDSSNNRVGIGTTSPAEKLDIDGNIKLPDNGNVHFGVSDTAFVRGKDSTDGYVLIGTNGAIAARFDTAKTLRMNECPSLDATAGSINITGGGSGGRIAIQGTSTSAGAGLAEMFAFWGTNKVAGMIALSGSDTTNKDDGHLTFLTSSAGPAVTERMRIDSSGRVIIGATSVSPANSYSNNLVVSEASGDAGMSIHGNNSNSNYASIYLSDAGAASRAYLEAQLGSGTSTNFTIGAQGITRFLNNGAERMRIDSSGNVGIGTNSPSERLSITNASGSGAQMQFRDNATGTASSDGFRVGYNGSGGQLWNFENNYVRFATNNTERVRIQAGGGMSFNGDTAAANALDDYEEGTWTPVPALTYNPSGRSITAGTSSGTYTKIGRLVHVEFIVAWTAISGSGSYNVGVNGLPFSANNTVQTSGGSGRSNVTGYTFVMENVNSSQINTIRRYDNGGPNENDSIAGFAVYHT